ncbi:MAG: prepilin-type N-terminal cleavage/methylation domain-containing protein [Candidatus Omnitrophica bacterium]|nr:prepilin-type N-terminal cleavage/methylation domain-containing protein [Candidatus Omnitrophota bacterium]
MSKRGFTLIEVLASILLIVVALIPIMMIVPQMIENSLTDERLTRVIFLGENKMEETKRGVVSDYDVDRSASGSFSLLGSDYEDYKYIITDYNTAGIKTLTVQVWYDENGDDTLDFDEQSITLDTRVADKG